MKRIAGFALALLCAVMAITPVATAQEQDFSGTTVRLAQQFGMHYAPVIVMQKMGILEKHLPGAALEWTQLSGGSALNEAMISGQLDVSFMGIPPYLIAWDKGVSYRIACGISSFVSEVMVLGEDIQSLKDIQSGDKIAVAGIGSTQHIILAMAAEDQLGDPHALDNNVVAMANPDALNAATSGTEVVGHVAVMPYIDMEIEKGMHSILNGEEALDGEKNSVVCVTTKAFHENQAVYDALVAALQESVDLVNGQSDEVLKAIAENERITPEKAKEYLNWKGALFSTDIYGFQVNADFMQATEYIKNKPSSLSEVCWPEFKPGE